MKILYKLIPWYVTITLLLGTAALAAELGVGSRAPALKAPSQDGTIFDLSGRKGSWTVVYFYPRDNTPGCTKEASAFNDALGQFRALGAEVVGVSRDDVTSHAGFAGSLKLSFPLVADKDGQISEKYGADGLLGMSKRWTYLIGPDLTIRAIYKSVDPATHPGQVLADLKRLAAKSP